MDENNEVVSLGVSGERTDNVRVDVGYSWEREVPWKKPDEFVYLGITGENPEKIRVESGYSSGYTEEEDGEVQEHCPSK